MAENSETAPMAGVEWQSLPVKIPKGKVELFRRLARTWAREQEQEQGYPVRGVYAAYTLWLIGQEAKRLGVNS